eukprot:GHVS01067365.1.p1 GENE.GHVS01067365.1~~GHVS01067365.1.p1  ORF type:complete len:716 (-),score=146.83 GHVS01067365.1:296-2443(-)
MVESSSPSSAVSEAEMLRLVGTFGRFQLRYALIMMGLTWYFCGSHTMLMVFTSFHPHRYQQCKQQQLQTIAETTSLETPTPITTKTTAGPTSEGGEAMSGGDVGIIITECNFDIPLSYDDCQPYSYRDVGFTVVSEFDLSSCSSPRITSEISCSMFFFGFMVGVSAFGFVSDKFGRRPALVSSSLCMQTGGMLCAIAPSMLAYSMLRFVTGVGVGGCGMAAYVIVTEIVSSQYRQLCTFIHSCFFALGAASVSIVVLLFSPTWRILCLVTSLGSLVLCLLWCSSYNIESPLWYAVNHRKNDAERIWNLIAKVNYSQIATTTTGRRVAVVKSEVDVTNNVFDDDQLKTQNKQHEVVVGNVIVLSPSNNISSPSCAPSSSSLSSPFPLPALHLPSSHNDNNSDGLRSLMSTPPFRLWLPVVLFMWLSCSFVYYGVALYLSKHAEHNNNSSSNSNVLSSTDTEGMRELAWTNLWCFLTEIPVVAVGICLVDVIGRKGVVVGGLLASACCCLVGYVLYVQSFTITSAYAAATGRVIVSPAFTALYLYTAELFPTSVRGVASGISSLGARVAGVTAPLVVQLDDQAPASPIALFGVLALVSAVAGYIAVPETLDRELCNTLDEESARLRCQSKQPSRRRLSLVPLSSSPDDELNGGGGVVVIGRPTALVVGKQKEGKYRQLNNNRSADIIAAESVCEDTESYDYDRRPSTSCSELSEALS